MSTKRFWTSLISLPLTFPCIPSLRMFKYAFIYLFPFSPFLSFHSISLSLLHTQTSFFSLFSHLNIFTKNPFSHSLFLNKTNGLGKWNRKSEREGERENLRRLNNNSANLYFSKWTSDLYHFIFFISQPFFQLFLLLYLFYFY